MLDAAGRFGNTTSASIPLALALNAGELTAEEAAMAKWWCTELQKRVVDRALQLHGGYGYMKEYPIEREVRDALSGTLYSGTSEMQRKIIASCLGL
jgi:alkylation response protein AidB-like acyl-CoA dehydrogenase